MTPNADYEGSGPEEAIAGHQWDIEGFLLHLWPGRVPLAGGAPPRPEQAVALCGHGTGRPVGQGGAPTGTAWDMLIECLDALILRNLGERGQT